MAVEKEVGALRLPPWPYHGDDEVEAVVHVLRSGATNQWTGGEVDAFGKEFATAVGVRHGIPVANGTVALEAALRALDIGPGDEVVVPSRTFIATASAVAAVGAHPVVADVEGASGNLSAQTIGDALTSRTRAIIPVHVGGIPCDMDPIMELAGDHGLKIVEDCAQAHGATYRGRAVGSIGDVGAFSFCQDKIMSTGGEGGMCVTDDERVATRLWSIKDHGKDFDTVFRQDHPPGFRWLHASFGTNWRMTEMQAAIGRVQLRKLPGWVQTRRSHAEILTSYLDGLPARVPTPPCDAAPSFYKFDFFVDSAGMRPGWGRDRIMATLQGQGIPARVGSCAEIYREQAFGSPRPRLPNARHISETSLSLPVHPTLHVEHVHAMGTAIRKVLERAQA